MSEQRAIYWTNCRVKLGDLKPWERNPKTNSKAHARRLLKNHKDFGQWQDVAIGPDNEVYDGHQRLNVWLAAYGPNFEIDAKRASRALTEQERERFVIEAHVGTVGSLNYDALANWNAPRLMEAGFDADLLKEYKTGAAALVGFLGAENILDEADAFGALPDEDRAPFQQMTFTLHDTQAEQVREALKVARAAGAFVDSENENSNGNALARICETYLTYERS